MTKQERDAARRAVRDASPHIAKRATHQWLKAALDALDAKDAIIRRLIDCSRGSSIKMRLAVADAERELSQ